MFRIKTLNRISRAGLSEFPRDKYEVGDAEEMPDAILVRSADMHGMPLENSVKAVARAGAGVNNIPCAALAERGIVVFNTPGANANAVKELTILALLLSSRPAISAHEWALTLRGRGAEIPALAEKGKSQFVGPELKGKTLGVVGLGAIGDEVANLAIQFGMEVVGYDPFLSVNSAWRLDRNVRHAEALDSVFAKSDYITLHVPETEETRNMISSATISRMKDGVRIVNFARGGLVNNADIAAALNSGKVASFVTDFASENLLACPKAICLPHLGASTPEAEDNCATQAAREIMTFLETGAVVNSVNFPRASIESPIPKGGTRICIAHKNIPGMIAQFSSILGDAGRNIAAMADQNRGEMAYAILDVDGRIENGEISRLSQISGVLSLRPIYG